MICKTWLTTQSCELTMSLQVGLGSAHGNANFVSDLATELILKGLAWQVLRTKMPLFITSNWFCLIMLLLLATKTLRFPCAEVKTYQHILNDKKNTKIRNAANPDWVSGKCCFKFGEILCLGGVLLAMLMMSQVLLIHVVSVHCGSSQERDQNLVPQMKPKLGSLWVGKNEQNKKCWNFVSFFLGGTRFWRRFLLDLVLDLFVGAGDEEKTTIKRKQNEQF